MNAKMIARRARVKASKKASKEGKKHKLVESSTTTTTDFKIPTASSSGSSTSDSSPDGETAAKKAKKTPSTTTAAFANQKDGKAKAGTSAASGLIVPKNVQDDPTKSEVYKRLFSSHKSAINQPRGHWVTFDPRYN